MNAEPTSVAPDPPVIGDDIEAFAALTWFAVDRLWQQAQLRDDNPSTGCCHICCLPCAALHYLDRTGVLDLVLDNLPEYARDHAATDTHGRLLRPWMYRLWDGTNAAQQQCGHRVDPPT